MIEFLLESHHNNRIRRRYGHRGPSFIRKAAATAMGIGMAMEVAVTGSVLLEHNTRPEEPVMPLAEVISATIGEGPVNPNTGEKNPYSGLELAAGAVGNLALIAVQGRLVSSLLNTRR